MGEIAESVNQLFRWDEVYRLSPTALIQFEVAGSQPLVSNSACLESYDRRVRATPNRIVELEFGNPDVWNFYAPALYRLSASQFRVLTGFIDPASPESVYEHVGFRECNRATFAQLIGMLHCLRILVNASDHSAYEPLPANSHKRGVMIVAVKPQYIRLACTLAESIRCQHDAMPIALLHLESESAVVAELERDRQLFDYKITHNSEDEGIHPSFIPGLMRLGAYKTTPFPETLLLDADTIMFPGRTLTAEFHKIDAVDFAPACSGRFDATIDDRTLCSTVATLGQMKASIANVDALRARVKLERPIWRIHAYFLLWRQTDSMKAYFEQCCEFLRILAASGKVQTYTGGLAEVMLSLVSSTLTVDIYSACYQPLADFVFTGADVNTTNLRRQFVGLTMIGRSLPGSYIQSYDSVVAEVARLRNDQRPNYWQGK